MLEGRMVVKPRLVTQAILGLMLLPLFCPAVAALDPSRKISQYGHNMWRIQDGYLPAPPEAIAQTEDGYLWIGTHAGLFRFDGVRFGPWTSPSGEKLPSNQIHYLLGTNDGSLWIGTAQGLARWKGGILRTYKSLPNSIWGIVEDHEGDIWIARWDSGDGRGPLCRIRDSDQRCFGRNDGIPLPIATGLALDSSGNFWVSGNEGLCKWKPGGSSVCFHRDLAKRGYLMGVDALSVVDESHVWIGLQQPDGNLQLQELDHGKWTPHPLPKVQGPPPSTNGLFRDREGALWISTPSDGVYRIFGGKTDHFSNADGLSSDSVQGFFFQDREGVLWVATTNGIDSFRDLPVVSYSIKEGLVSDHVSTVLASQNGGLWIGGAEALGFLKQNKLSAIRTNHGLPGRDITTMSEDSHGRLWVGVDSSLSVLEHGRFLPIHKSNESSFGIVLGIAEDAAGDEWVLTRDILFRIENLQVRQQISLPQPCFSIAGDSKKGVWLGCVSGDLAHYYDDRSETFPHISASNIRQLLPAPGGGLWAVAEDAFIWWNDNKTATMKTTNGLPCNELYAAVQDDAGALWLYARCGLFSVPASELTRWHENPSMQVNVESLDVYCGAEPGMTPLQPQATRSIDGRLWFANNNVVQTFDPRKWPRNQLPPNVIVEGLEANGARYSVQRDLRLPALIRNLDIEYTALSFVVPQKVRFRYKLEGYDTEWGQPVSRREVSYTNLPPGHYEFRVIASNDDGVWNETGAGLAFTIPPSFTQGVWFKAICLFGFVGFVYSAYRLRVRQVTAQLRGRMYERLAERERIARDLHDTFFQGIQGLLLRFHTATSQLGKDEPARQIFEETLKQSDHVMLEGRELVLDLRATTSEQNELPTALVHFGEGMRNGRSCEFKVVINGSIRPLHPVVFEELFKIGKEALGNAFRHSGAHSIEAELNYERNEMRIRIRDDGMGIDSAILQHGYRDGHFGLPGMRERAKKIGAHLDVWSGTGAGTEVEVRIPAGVAYVSDPNASWFWKLKRLWEGTKQPESPREKGHVPRNTW
jgi:signal transduction histidine kinase/ligand-binding sensor domain-containing protein